MSLIQFKRTSKKYDEVGKDNIPVGEQELTPAEPTLIDTSDGTFVAIGKKNLPQTKLKDAPVLKAFNTIEKANSLVFRDGEKLITENGLELGATKINVKEISEMENAPTLLYIVLVDDDNNAYKVNIGDFLKLNKETGCIDFIGW